ncbi:MAG: hypothetical protein P8R54_15145 [Myxococcota bacterium]|nr:hypothetical protein [Myxococcota bacterium]
MPENKSTASKHKWFADEMVWKRQKGRAKVWTADSPPLPAWAKASRGAVSPSRFVRMYTAADSLSTLKSQLFWLSLGELEALRAGISQWLSANNVTPLAPFQAPPAVLDADALSALLSDGTLKPLPGSARDHRLNPPPEVDPEELDLTPTPPRPNEDPLQGKTFNEIMHLPEASNEKQMVTMMGMGKVRMSAKH